jgi:hypothetical protein
VKLVTLAREIGNAPKRYKAQKTAKKSTTGT